MAVSQKAVRAVVVAPWGLVGIPALEGTAWVVARSDPVAQMGSEVGWGPDEREVGSDQGALDRERLTG